MLCRVFMLCGMCFTQSLYIITLFFFSVHTLFKYLQRKIHIFAPFTFLSTVTNSPNTMYKKMMWNRIYQIYYFYLCATRACMYQPRVNQEFVYMYIIHLARI